MFQADDRATPDCDAERLWSNPGWTPAEADERATPGAFATGIAGELYEGAMARRAAVRSDWNPSPTPVPVLWALDRARARLTELVGAPTVGVLAVRCTLAPCPPVAPVRTVRAPSTLRLAANPVRAVDVGSGAGSLDRRTGR
ncbi:MAG: hypothetical protein KDA24_30260 [Deltaproteobacteria bacterium]|nr:hypothetical protein [Deltaproteobacteria bacterium]